MINFIRNNRWPVAIAVVAVLVRMAYLLDWNRLPDFIILMVDEKWHWLWADEIVHDSFWGKGAFFRAPLYPYFLAFLSWLTGGSILVSKLLQVVLSGGTAWFIYHMSYKLFGYKAAILSGLIYAVYGTLVFYESMFLIPVLFLFLVVWGIYRVVQYSESPSWRTWLLTGIIFGLAAISRPNILIVIPFLMLWLFFISDKTRSFSQRARLPLLLFCGVILMILPVTIRNVIVVGEPILISSQGGINLYFGNNPQADGLTMLMPEMDLNESVNWQQFETVTKRAAEAEVGRELSESELSSFWTGKALRFIVDHPGHFAGLLWRKTVYLLSGFENSDNIDIYRQRQKSFLHKVLVWDKPIFFPFGLMLPLTLIGIFTTRKKFRSLLPLYLFMLAYVPSIILFLVTARHRLPLIPFMIIIASGGLVTLWQSVRVQSARNLIAILALFLIPLLVLNRTFYEAAPASAFQFYFNEGIKYEKLGDYVKAEEAYLLANRDFPNSVTLLNNLGNAQRILGKTDEAQQTLERAITLDTAYAPSYNNLGLVMRLKNDIDSARELYRAAVFKHKAGPDAESTSRLSQYYLNAAEIYETLDIVDTAKFLYRVALEADSSYARAYFKAAAYYARLQDYSKSDSLFHSGIERGQPSAIDLFNWGLSYMRRQEFRNALNRLHEATRADSSVYQAYHCVAVIYYENNMPADSVSRYVELALKHNPNYGPSWELKRIISGQ